MLLLRVPCIGLDSLRTQKRLFVIENNDFTPNSIDQVLEGYFAGTISNLDQTIAIHKSISEANEKRKLVNETKNIVFLEFYSYMQDRDIDKIVFVYNSSTPENDSFWRKAAMLNFLAKANRDSLHNHNLLFASIDIARSRLDDSLTKDSRFEIDSLILIPAHQTEGPYAVFPHNDETDWTASNLTLFIEEHRDFKYKPSTEQETIAFKSLKTPLDDRPVDQDDYEDDNDL